MNITKSFLRKLIQEETTLVLREVDPVDDDEGPAIGGQVSKTHAGDFDYDKDEDEVFEEEDQELQEKWKDDYETPKSKEGDCTPMRKSTCTPRRKAFARRAKAGWPKGEGSTPGYGKRDPSY
tara:strand:+ start:126 stop:491 length:366 start_codon:yes stop_codon:yes gene_type:complete